jgi:hypothetical protein
MPPPVTSAHPEKATQAKTRHPPTSFVLLAMPSSSAALGPMIGSKSRFTFRVWAGNGKRTLNTLFTTYY